MISILFVGDGPRDSVALPRIVGHVLATEVAETCIHWKEIRLQRGGGYDRKLLFAVRQAQDANRHAVVAVVDGDNDRKGLRLRELQAARTKDRIKNPAFPTALGQAIPHGEAWLLDDSVAVRTALRLAGNAALPNVSRCKNPKEELEGLIRACERAKEDILSLLAEVASQVTLNRCAHAKETGFGHFVEEVRTELGPLALS